MRDRNESASAALANSLPVTPAEPPVVSGATPDAHPAHGTSTAGASRRNFALLLVQGSSYGLAGRAGEHQHRAAVPLRGLGRFAGGRRPPRPARHRWARSSATSSRRTCWRPACAAARSWRSPPPRRRASSSPCPRSACCCPDRASRHQPDLPRRRARHGRHRGSGASLSLTCWPAAYPGERRSTAAASPRPRWVA